MSATVNLFDRVLSQAFVPAELLQGSALACMFLASKLHERHPLALRDISSLAGMADPQKTINELEMKILCLLRYDVNSFTVANCVAVLASRFAGPGREAFGELSVALAHLALKSASLALRAPPRAARAAAPAAPAARAAAPCPLSLSRAPHPPPAGYDFLQFSPFAVALALVSAMLAEAGQHAALFPCVQRLYAEAGLEATVPRALAAAAGVMLGVHRGRQAPPSCAATYAGVAVAAESACGGGGGGGGGEWECGSGSSEGCGGSDGASAESNDGTG